MRDFKEVKTQWLKDRELKKAYDELGPRYDLITAVIRKRLRRGLTQAELAQKVGTKQSAIARFESGDYNPSLFFVQRLAKALNSKLTLQLK